MTQDDDSEMTGFCPEAKVGLHAPFSCDMLVQAASAWHARSEPLRENRSDQQFTQALKQEETSMTQYNGRLRRS